MIKSIVTDGRSFRKKANALNVIFILLLTAIGLIFIYYQSFQNYCQQTYHIDFENLAPFFNAEKSNKLDSPASTPPVFDSDTAALTAEPKTGETSEAPLKENVAQPIVLAKSDMVFFAGDSLMQGVAPHVKKMLFKQYKIESINLSKQSTGLIYPEAFDWPKTIDETLEKNPSIKLLVMFLGPNDPWKFPIKRVKRYAEFKTPEWEENYRLRIRKILASAKQHQVSVLWLAVPCMRKKKLNNDIIYLNRLYQSETEESLQHFLSTNEFLGCTYDRFNNFIDTDRANIKVRLDDGIHFTTAGQKILARAIMQQITVN